MPRLKNKFIVFKEDTEIFKYIPTDDDGFIENGTAFLYETLSAAKEVATLNFISQMKELTYKSFK